MIGEEIEESTLTSAKESERVGPFKGDGGAIRLPGQGARRGVWPYAPTSLPGLLPLGGKHILSPKSPDGLLGNRRFSETPS